MPKAVSREIELLPNRVEPTVETSGLVCPVCSETEGKTVEMRVLGDLVECPDCKTSFIDSNRSPLTRWMTDWQEIAESNYPLMRPPFGKMDFPNPFLLELYHDAYFSILLGRPNAGIVMLGVLLEALVKEVIYVNEGSPFQGEFGPALSRAELKRYLRVDDVKKLRDFKDRIRNLYQHAQLDEIVRGKTIRFWEIAIDPQDPIGSIEKAKREIERGSRQPKYALASSLGSLGIVVKQRLDKERAIPLFNSVHDYLIEAQVRYLSAQRYKDFGEKFGHPVERAWFTLPWETTQR